MSEPTVFIIDDDPSARRGVTRLVRAAGMNAESFASAKDFLASERCEGPGCVVLDVRMPDMTGPELQEEMSKAEYCMPIIFISASADIPTATRAMKKGAVDFLTKPFDEEDLLKAVQEALKKDVANRSAMNERQSILQRIQLLTPREYEILTYVLTGMLNKQIAYDLDISEKTVKVHRGRVMEKLGVDSVAELVRLSEKAGIEPAQVSDF